MAETIAKIILGGSLVGIGLILIRKIPLLKTAPEIETKDIETKSLFSKIKNWVKSLFSFSPNLIFQKILSKIRVSTLIFERKVENKLQRLREEAKAISVKKIDDYWEKLKEVKEKEKKDSSK